jgi:hypothetical protein
VSHPSLYKLVLHASKENPWHNFFTEGILRLRPWSPEETWNFLEPRLAGFGITLPGDFAGEALTLCRGLPWIAQTLGLALCKAHSRRRRQITRGDWGLVAQDVGEVVRCHIKDLVADVTTRLDQAAGIDPLQDLQTALGGSRLWNALAEQASSIALSLPSSDSGQWPDSHWLDMDRLGDRLHGIPRDRWIDALVQLSEVGLLQGEEENTRFQFWNDLLPAILSNERG